MKDMEINEKIRYFRKQRGLSQELLAERTGINVNTIRKYEIGIRKPKVEQLKKIADGSDGLGRRKVICAVQHNLFIEADSEKLKPMTSRQFVGKWKGVKFQ